jgi:predicted aldo/keto reductase-like oxidoreductase
VLGAYNESKILGDLKRARMSNGWIDEKVRGDRCIECGECLEKCPQGIDLPGWLKKVHEALGQETQA